MRVLDSRTIAIKEDLTIDGPPTQRFIKRGGAYLCGEDNDSKARAYDFALMAGSLVGKSVAWIGGGLFVGPKLFATYGCKQTVFEIEPALVEFCPPEVTFVPGNWQDSFYGTYDIIVYDIGGDTPQELSKYLNPKGVLLPKET